MHPGKRSLGLATFLLGWLVSCGAQNTPGPAPLPKPQHCRSMDQLAPALMDSLKGPDSAKLRVVIDRTHLWDAQADGLRE